jgi:hypothetical protein
MSQVAPQIVEPWKASLVAKRVQCLRGASGFEARGACGLGGAEPTTPGVLCGHLHVLPQLLFEIGVAPAWK